MGFTVTENRGEVSAETPDFNEMVAEAARWKGLQLRPIPVMIRMTIKLALPIPR
jgi:hypothetical protein